MILNPEQKATLKRLQCILLVLLLSGVVILSVIDIFVTTIPQPITNYIYLSIAVPLTILIIIFKFQEWKTAWARPKGSRKGGIERIVTDEMAYTIPELLKNSGIETNQKSIKVERGIELKIPQFQMICSIPDSDKVVLYFSRSTLDLTKLIVSLQPTVSKWWRIKPDLKTLHKIASILDANGAMPLPDSLR